MGDFTAALLRLLVGLPLVAVLAYFSLKYGLGRRGMAGSGRYLRVVEQVSLGPRIQVSVLKAGEKYLLVGSSEGGVNLLRELADYVEVEKEALTPFPWFKPGFNPGGKGGVKP